MRVISRAPFFGFFSTWWYGFADEVRDAGDALIVRKEGEEARIPLADIVSVKAPLFSRNERRVVLTLRTPCRFGNEVTFLPIRDGFFMGYRPTPMIVNELIERIDKTCALHTQFT